MEIRSARLPDGGIVTTYTDVTQTVAGRRRARRGQRAAGAARAASAPPNSNGSTANSPRQDRGGGGEPLQDALSRRRRPRHLAAAQRGAALRQFADRKSPPTAAARSASRWRATSTLRSRRSRRSSARCSTFRGSTPARRGREIGDFRDRRHVPSARDRVRADGARQGTDAALRSASLDSRALRPAADAPPAAEPRLQRAQIHAEGPRAGRLPAPSAAQVRIEVWDTGLGIPADQQRLVFEEFQRLDQGARAARGLGLGLSIVERLGRVLGHPIAVRSWPGRGSVFSVVAPRGAVGAAPAAEPGAPEPRVAGDALQGPARAGDRQRAARARRHARAADQMGLQGRDRARPARSARGARRRSTACPTRSSPTTISTKATASSAIAAVARSARRAHAGDSRHRRPQRRRCAKRRRAPTSRCSTSR